MIEPFTKRICLRPLGKDDLPILWRWRNGNDFRSLCSCRRNEVDFVRFVQELDNDFATDRHEQYVVCSRSRGDPIGTIFSYNFSEDDGHCFVTTFLSEEAKGVGLGVEAFLLFGIYLFQKYKLFKIYTEVYEYNSLSLSTMIKWGFGEEGRFRGHRLYQERRWDLIRLAVYQKDECRALKLLRVLGLSKQQ